MPIISDFHVFLITSVILILAPGPDIIFLLAQSLAHGAKAGLPTAFGLAAGNLFHTLMVALGISALIHASPHAFTAIKIMGAIYLLYLAYMTFRSLNTPTVQKNHREKKPHALFIQAVTMNLLNPKVALFFIAFLPQFIPQHSSNITSTIIFLGIIFTGLVLIIFSTLSLTITAIQRRLPDTLQKTSYFEWLAIIVYLLLALRLLILSGQ